MLMCTSPLTMRDSSRRKASISWPFLPIDAWPRGVDRDARLLRRPLDDDLADPGLLEALVQKLSDLHVLEQEVAVLRVEYQRDPVRLTPRRRPTGLTL